MNMAMQGHVYPPFRLHPDRALAAKFMAGQGIDEAPDAVPPTYLIFLRAQGHGVDLFRDLDIPHHKALHGGQRYEWFADFGWDDELEVTVTIEKLVEKEGRSGTIWFADIAYDYARADTGERVVREITRIVKRS